MAQSIKILGQRAGTTSTGICVYNVPASTSATVSTITISNNTTAAQSFKLWLQLEGAGVATGTTGVALPAVTTGSYLYYDQVIDANSTFAITLGITLGADASIVASTSSTSMSINVFGVEVS
jgi:hypothetical protein